MRPWILGHRGFSARFPENTLLAFEKAMEAGADGVELDVRCTLDGQVLVIHDETLERVSESGTATPPVRDLPYGQVREYRLPMGQHPPLLQEVFAVLPPGCWINVEIKEEAVVPPLISLLRSVEAPQRILFSSFLHHALLPLREAFPNIPVGLLVGKLETQVPDPAAFLKEQVQHIHPYSLHLPVKILDIMGVSQLKEWLAQPELEHLKVFWWTPDEPEFARKMYAEDLAFGIITNEVEKMRAELGPLF
ncbi:MAG TPA: glycerophosphodiester phosphodiesterase family protein [Thermotogota bacterium]|nr:glycerophosphodiester phosphodiesterase family protein [Thermotogota bacterium]HRW92877.1 glycerophosphodiester phosphodiesterase family protein [Thermotogota bacterium]